ncbi:hypothetical protein [Undibacterium crateris]|uniref:hypothetical protein n=1 Tax=Undibacterium crateris TaxID=2528175 RepID=UPI001389BD88|nr:hypothetical protein [Undibacterium crateris]NDI85699.1 hypothetical protein [Undibacterium crateris]
MKKLSFKDDIKCLFSKYATAMSGVKLASESGTKILQLGDYESVKFFYYQIQVAIHGYDYDRKNSKWVVKPEERLPVRGGQQGEFVKEVAHPMPPAGKLPQEAINLYDQWVREGMHP